MRHRMHAICPYFAMFPEDFVGQHVEEFTSERDWVFDPFSGRGTTLFQSLLMNRRAAAIDINPVAYCITAAKAEEPELLRAVREINRLEAAFGRCSRARLRSERQALPLFFRRAFYWTTLEQILFLRRALKWRCNRAHRFLAALALGSLHGERDKPMQYFSNQMPRTISTKPDYSLRYWRKHNLWPHKRDVFSILRDRAAYRLHQSMPSAAGKVALTDARKASRAFPDLRAQVRAVITSPPYLDVTNFEEDQWLRLWFLGHEPRPTYRSISNDDRHRRQEPYWQFLAEAWAGIAPMLQDGATLVCRMGARGMSESQITRGLAASLRPTFPMARLLRGPTASPLRRSQVRSFRPGCSGCLGEWDYVFDVSGS